MFALNRSGQVSTSIATKGLAKASAADVQEYSRMVGSAVDMLLSRGCSQSEISYETPSGSNSNPKAPSDKRCHVFNIAGGNIRYRDLGLDECNLNGQLTKLNIGQNCGGIVYAGMSGGNRIYTTMSDLGSFSWNKGTSNWTTTGATSLSDGKANTDLLLSLSDAGAPYAAAVACRALGLSWYLPSRDEMVLLNTNKVAIGGFVSTFGITSHYWTSTESGLQYAWVRRFDANANTGSLTKSGPLAIRCVRR